MDAEGIIAIFAGGRKHTPRLFIISQVQPLDRMWMWMWMWLLSGGTFGWFVPATGQKRRPVWPLIKIETTKLTKNLHFNTKMRGKHEKNLWSERNKDKLIILSVANS